MTPYDWGVVEMEVDEKALAAGQLQLLRFFGILPDGPARRPSSAASPRPAGPARRRSTSGASKKSLDVYLGVARERGGVASYGNAERLHDGPRFSVVSRSVADLIASESVSRGGLRPAQHPLLFGTEPREDYDGHQDRRAGAEQDRRAGAGRPRTSRRACASPRRPTSWRACGSCSKLHARQAARAVRHAPPPGRVLAGVHRARRDALPAAQRAQRHHPPGAPRAGDGEPASARRYLYLLVQAAGQLSTLLGGARSRHPPQVPVHQPARHLRGALPPLSRPAALRGLEQCIAVAARVPQGRHVPGPARGRAAAALHPVRPRREAAISPERQVADQLPRPGQDRRWDEIHNISRPPRPACRCR